MSGPMTEPRYYTKGGKTLCVSCRSAYQNHRSGLCENCRMATCHECGARFIKNSDWRVCASCRGKKYNREWYQREAKKW